MAEKALKSQHVHVAHEMDGAMEHLQSLLKDSRIKADGPWALTCVPKRVTTNLQALHRLLTFVPAPPSSEDPKPTRKRKKGKPPKKKKKTTEPPSQPSEVEEQRFYKLMLACCLIKDHGLVGLRTRLMTPPSVPTTQDDADEKKETRTKKKEKNSHREQDEESE